MIARIRHGKTKARDATAYLEYLFKSGFPAYRATSGNKGAWVLRRMKGDVAHFIALSFWESRDAIVAFAGADPSAAKYYAEDEKILAGIRTHPNTLRVVRVIRSTDLGGSKNSNGLK